jgi:Zn-dependent protease
MEIAIISIVVLVFSVILHEVAHGYAADMLGDMTARYVGRLTLNPIPHIDLYGSIILPAALTFLHSPVVLGWAKPVPYNPHNMRHPYAEALVAIAGPATNFFLAFVFGLLMRAGVGAGDVAVSQLLFTIVTINTLLGIFNLLPIPPLDGSKVLHALLPRGLQYQYDVYRRNFEGNPLLGLGAIVFFVLIFGSVFHSFVFSVARLFAGV